MSLTGSPGRRPWRLGILVAAIAWAGLELSALGAARVLRGRGLFYAPTGDLEGFAAYMERRDPLLGWPARSADASRGASGARRDPAFPPDREPCVALYGDSQTWGAEVSPGEAWGSVLGRRLGCRVANYGVNAYGSDQALLRYLDRDPGRAAHVVLGHWSENVLRNVNQYRELLYPAPYGLKPRFTLEAGGRLRHVPIPTLDPGGFQRLQQDPSSVLRHEFFLPGTRWGPTPLRFPWSVAVLRATRSYRVSAGIAGEPAYARFYDPDHPSGAMPLTAAILTRFRDEARRRGQHPTPLLIPTGLDLRDRARGGGWHYGPLADRLAAAGVRFLDAGPPLLERLGGRDPCELFDDCSAHFDPEGNALLAEVVFDHLCALPEESRRSLPGCRDRPEPDRRP